MIYLVIILWINCFTRTTHQTMLCYIKQTILDIVRGEADDAFKAALILEAGADAGAGFSLEFTDGEIYELTPLMWAARTGKAECVSVLLKYGAVINNRDKFGCTALTWASKSGQLACVVCLLGHGGDINTSCNIGNTPLIWASCKGHTECVRLLLQHGADRDLTNRFGMSAIDIAEDYERAEVLLFLKL